MASSYFQLLSLCPDERLKKICETRRLPVPNGIDGSPESRHRLLKTMEFHLESNKLLVGAIAGLPSGALRALKAMAGGGAPPDEGTLMRLFDLGLALPGGGAWEVPGRVGDALEDFDDGALSFQAEGGADLLPAREYGFSLALTSILLRCVNGIRVLKGGLPAKKDLAQLLGRNAFLTDERDATLLFALLHRMGLLWSRQDCVDTLVPAVLARPPRWVAERAFAKRLEDDIRHWKMPAPEDRRFLMQHLLERRGQALAARPFLGFLQTLRPLDEARVAEQFLPFLARMGLVAVDAGREHLSLTEHGAALSQEYLMRDPAGTEAHWAPLSAAAPLVAQATLEMLTPAVQDPHRLLKLAQLADVETTDTMVAFRFGPAAFVRALDSGVSLDEARSRIRGGEGAELPQPLESLMQYLGDRLGEVEVEQGVRLVKTKKADLASELRVRPELAQLALEPISDTVMQVRGAGNAYALLKQAGFVPKPVRFLPVSIDDNERLYIWSLACLSLVMERGMSLYLEPVQQLIRDALRRIQSDDPALFQEIRRRVPMLHPEGGSQAQEEQQRIMEYASEHGLAVEITYMPVAGERAQERRVTPRSVEGEHLRAYCHLHQEVMAFRLARIMGVRLLSEKAEPDPHPRRTGQDPRRRAGR
jgi:hypothetical protein